MIKPNKSGCFLRIVLLVLVSASAAGVAHAEDVVPAREQSDEKISVWANNATLEVFVSQLAVMTGRRVEIEDGLEARVSGRFNGSMVDTLNAVTEQHQMLFDLDQNVLGVVAESARSSATIPLNGSSIDEALQASLSFDGLAGNEIQLRDDEVLVSGHPQFVKRVAKIVATSVADAGQKLDTEQAPGQQVSVESLTVENLLDSALDASADSNAALPSEPGLTSERVIDAAATVMLEQAADESLSEGTSDAVTASPSPRPIRWVTDIPGFETF